MRRANPRPEAVDRRVDRAAVPGQSERSRELEERAETLLNLGRLSIAHGDERAARPFFLRAVWVFPRLAAAIPPAGDPDGIAAEVARLEAALPTGGAPPPPPPPLRLR